MVIATKDDAQEAEMMTAMLSGFTFSGLQKIEDILTPPIEWLQCDPAGTIKFRLASGMLVTVSITVEPVTC